MQTSNTPLPKGHQPGDRIPASDLQLADHVQVIPIAGPYVSGTVIDIEGGWAKVLRPYVHTADFSYTGGVIPYIGFEHVMVRLDATPIILWERKQLR